MDTSDDDSNFILAIEDIDLLKLQQIEQPREFTADHKFIYKILYDGKPYRVSHRNIEYVIKNRDLYSNFTPEYQKTLDNINTDFRQMYCNKQEFTEVYELVDTIPEHIKNNPDGYKAHFDVIILFDSISKTHDKDGNILRIECKWIWEYMGRTIPDFLEKFRNGTLNFKLQNAPEYMREAVFKFCKKEDRVCPICCGEIENDKEMFITPCHHLYHRSCLAKAHKFNKSCGICKKIL